MTPSFVDDLGRRLAGYGELVMAPREEFETEILTRTPRRSPRFSRPSTTSIRQGQSLNPHWVAWQSLCPLKAQAVMQVLVRKCG